MCGSHARETGNVWKTKIVPVVVGALSSISKKPKDLLSMHRLTSYQKCRKSEGTTNCVEPKTPQATGYLAIIPRARVGYEMIDSQRGA